MVCLRRWPSLSEVAALPDVGSFGVSFDTELLEMTVCFGCVGFDVEEAVTFGFSDV